MNKIKLSIVIPSYKDPFLKNTILDLIEKSCLGKDELEILPILDGYWVKAEDIVSDPRVNYVHLGKNGGMRNAINMGFRIAKGKYVMRLDEHCMFKRGYDASMVKNCQPNSIIAPVRYFLDPVKWEVMDKPPVYYEKLAIRNGKLRKFEGQRWDRRTRERKKHKVDENMATQGACIVMRRSWWNKVVKELDTERYGPHNFDQMEMVFKTWKAGGKLLLNKRTWFAHKHRSFPRTHSGGTKETPGRLTMCFKNSIEDWGEYYNEVIRPRFGFEKL